MSRQAPSSLQRRLAPFALLLLIAAGLFIIVYQIPLRLTVPIGGDLDERRRFDDEPFLQDVNGSEPADTVPDPDNPTDSLLWYELLARTGGTPYRWTRANSSFEVPGAGGGSYIVSLRATSGRPDGSSAPVIWTFSAGPQLEFDLPSDPRGPRRYHIIAPTDNSGDLRLTMRSPLLDAPGDPRELGFVLYDIEISPTIAGWRSPAWPQIGALLLTLSLIATSAALLAVPRRLNLALTGGAALGAALALAFARPAITFFTPALFGLSLFALAVAATAYLLSRARTTADTIFARRVTALILLAFVLRLGGMLHPHALYSDSGFHANKLFALELGQVFQSATLPDEAGGGETPYPTGAYLLIAPGALLLPDDHRSRVLLMQSGTAFLDSLTVGLIALVLLRAGMGRAAALFGAACYLLPITAMESFAVGELANLGGQALAMPWIALLALGYAGTAYARQPLIVVGLISALCAGLLGHSGVTLSVGAFTAAAWAMSWFSSWRSTGAALDPRRLTIIAAMALLLVILGYYSAPRYLTELLGGTTSGAETTGSPPFALLRETVLGVLGMIPPRARAWPLPFMLGLTAIGGLVVLWRTKRSEAAGLRIVLAASWLGMLLTQGLLLVADQGVRWSIFLYPALCLSAGILLGALWKRRWPAKVGAALITCSILGYGLFMWIIQIRDYFHL